MIDGSTVSANEHGLLRVFFLDEVPEFDAGGVQAIKAIWAAIGLPDNSLGDVQVVNADYFPNGLSEFLIEGYGIEEKDMFEHKLTLDQFKGMAAIIRSSSIGQKPVDLVVDGPAKLAATFREPDADTAFPDQISTLGAMGVLTPPPQKKTPSDAAMSGRIATIVLLLMGLLVWLMIKIAG